MMKKFVISREDLVNNAKEIVKMADKTNVIGVLKGNGYGLGIAEFATCLREGGVEMFAVADIGEAVILRENGFDNEILLLSSQSVSEIAEKICKYDIIAAVGSVDSIKVLDSVAKENGKTIKVHIKADTGFGRFGFCESEYDRAYEALNEADSLEVCGLFSHFSNSFGKDRKSVDKQLGIFKKAKAFFETKFELKTVHIANSSAFLRYKDTWYDAVRLGSAFLGRLSFVSNAPLKRIGYGESQIIEIKDLPKGHNIGYADTYKTKKDMTIAVVPIGYKDGFGVERSKDTFRMRDMIRYVLTDIKTCLKTKHLAVQVNGKNMNLVGRVGMYNCIIDVTGQDVKVGDKVIFNINPLFCDSTVEREYR